MQTQKFTLLPAQSSIDWVGKKVSGSHNGTIAIKEGELILEEGRLIGGKFIIDTTSIKILDITDPAVNAQFAEHLASDDFFSSKKYPEAIFEITSVSGYHVFGDLTIRGITHPINFDILLSLYGDTLNAAGKMIIDRTNYDMKFRSGNFFKNLGDNLIYNDIELNVTVAAKTEKTPVLV
jgi:polyisoprenoid-binding protein YceI